jgi:hypothetical protein
MSSSVVCLYLCLLLCDSDEEATRTRETQTSPQRALLCLDGRSASHLRNQLREARAMQRFQHTQLRRYRQLDAACLGSYRTLVEEMEPRVLEADRCVVETERMLRFWGLDPRQERLRKFGE